MCWLGTGIGRPASELTRREMAGVNLPPFPQSPAWEKRHLGKRVIRARNQWQLEQLDELQLEQPDEPRELTDLPPLENPKREMLFLTRLLLHFSHGGNGEFELGTIVSKT